MAWWRGIAISAAAALWFAAGIAPAMAGAEEEIEALVTQARAARDAKNDPEAQALGEKALSIAEQNFGPDSEAAIAPLVILGGVKASAAIASQGGWGEAETVLQRALSLREKYPTEDKRPDLGKILLALAVVIEAQKKYDDADKLFDRYFEYTEARIIAKKLRPDDTDVSQAVLMQATGYLIRGRIGDLQRRSQRVIALSEQYLGYDHPYVGVQVFQLGLFIGMFQGPAVSQPFFERFVAIAKKALADSGADLGPSVTRDDLIAKLNRAAERLMAAGQNGKAQEALAIARDARAAAPQQANPETAVTETDPDALARQIGDAEKRNTRAELLPLRKQLFQLRQQAFAANSGDVRVRAGLAEACQKLADHYFETDLFDEAEPMSKCVLLVREMEGDKLKIAEALDKLGTVHERLGRLGEAEETLKRAIALIEEVTGSDTPDASPLRIRVVGLMAKQGRTEESVKYGTANPEADKKLFARPPGVRNALADLDNWGSDPAAQSRYSPMEQRALDMNHKLIGMLGPDSPNLVQPFVFTSSLMIFSKDWANATGYLDRAAKIAIKALQRGGASGPVREDDTGYAQVFLHLAKAGYRLAQEEPGEEARLRDSMFMTAQWAQHSAAAGALALMAARPQNNPELARIARERQDLSSERRELDAGLFAAVSLGAEARQEQAGKEQERRARLAAIDKRIDGIDAALLKQFPKYAELVNPAPLSVAQVQALLKPAEALVLFLDEPKIDNLNEEDTLAWVVTREQVRWARIGIGGARLAGTVFALRCGLDGAAWRGEGAAACEKAVKAKNEFPDKPLPYDLGRAHELYRALFGPFADLIEDKRLLIAASGPLTSLPLQALVTEKPREALPDWKGYRGVKWLGRAHAIAVLPSVPSLSVLRKQATAAGAAEPFRGYGDPKLDGNPECADVPAPEMCPGEGAAGRSAPTNRGGNWRAGGFANYFRGGLGDVNTLRKLCPLPEAALELGCVARSLKAKPGSVLTGMAATESAVKHAALDRYRVLHFATHGLVAGETAMVSGGRGEPALVMTPPEVASEGDDGLLTASEISQLKLNADWVVLSACNTAEGEKTGAEALSGLARAFFYAGARSLLVSHWEVNSYATTTLTTQAFKELSGKADIGPAKALQRSQAALMDDAERPWNAHPSFWAPFVLVGEGTHGGTRVAGAGEHKPGDAAKPQSPGAKPLAAGAKPKATAPAAAQKQPPAH